MGGDHPHALQVGHHEHEVAQVVALGVGLEDHVAARAAGVGVQLALEGPLLDDVVLGLLGQPPVEPVHEAGGRQVAAEGAGALAQLKV